MKNSVVRRVFSSQRLRARYLWAIASCVSLAACPAPSSKPEVLPIESRTIKVAATVGMVADLVRNVGGDRVSVTQICGAGVDPHLYKPSRDDVGKLYGADIVFYCGLKLEGKMADTLAKVSQQKPVVPIAEVIATDDRLQPPDSDGHVDPHVWMDVEAWMKCVGVVVEELSTLDPRHADLYATHAAAYLEQMASLDSYGKDAIATIPLESRVLVTSHDAFNYFGRAYDIEVDAVQGISTESEAGLAQINRLVDQLVEKKIRAVFVESSVSPKNIRALIEGAQAQSHTVEIGGELFSDAMGPDGTYEGTYLGMMDHNLTIITRALGGEAPEAGFNGKLK